MGTVWYIVTADLAKAGPAHLSRKIDSGNGMKIKETLEGWKHVGERPDSFTDTHKIWLSSVLDAIYVLERKGFHHLDQAL